MEIAPAAGQFFLRQLRIPLFAARSLSTASRSSSSSSTRARRRYPPPPPHEFSKPCEFLGSWKPVENPREAEARLDRLRKDYAKQVSQLRKEYAHEMIILSAEKQRKKEAKREAIRLANEERKVAKSAAAVALAAQRKAFQEEFRQTLYNNVMASDDMRFRGFKYARRPKGAPEKDRAEPSGSARN